MRDIKIDIIKGIAIIMVVAVHTGKTVFNCFSNFHIALFIIASGFTYRNDYSKNLNGVLSYVKRKLKLLYKPYVLWTAIFTLLHNFFIKVNIYTNNPEIYNYVKIDGYDFITPYMSIKDMATNIFKSLFFGGGTLMGGTMWFLKVLFYISVLYCLIDYLLNKLNIRNALLAQSIMSIVFLLIGFFMNAKNINVNCVGQCFSYYALYNFGVIQNRKQHFLNEFNNYQNIIIMFISFPIICVLNGNILIGFSTNTYDNPLILILSSLSGWFFVYEIAFFASKTTFIKSAIVEIGKNSLSIMILHYLAFKIVNALKIIKYHLPKYCIAALPTFYGWDSYWFIIYLIIGVYVPIFANKIFINLKNALINRKYQ